MITKTYVNKCPHCNSNISYVAVHFPFENEFGLWVIECSICSKKMTIRIKNPDESKLIKGGTILEIPDPCSLNEQRIETIVGSYPECSNEILVSDELKLNIITPWH